MSQERRSEATLKPMEIATNFSHNGASKRSVSTTYKLVRPKEILPNLHKKTHYKAAQEYSMIDKNNYKSSLDDRDREIEKQLQGANF
jgi:hypothetical protein